MGSTYEPAAVWIRMEYTTVIGPPRARSQVSTTNPQRKREKDMIPKGKHGCLSVLSIFCVSCKWLPALGIVLHNRYHTEYCSRIPTRRLVFWGEMNSWEAVCTSQGPSLSFHIYSQ